MYCSPKSSQRSSSVTNYENTKEAKHDLELGSAFSAKLCKWPVVPARNTRLISAAARHNRVEHPRVPVNQGIKRVLFSEAVKTRLTIGHKGSASSSRETNIDAWTVCQLAAKTSAHINTFTEPWKQQTFYESKKVTDCMLGSSIPESGG